MNIDAIYTDSKLYHIQRTQPLGQTDFALPAKFSGIAALYECDTELLPEAMATFLRRVVEGGMKHDPDTVLMANLNFSNVSLSKLAESGAVKVVVIFGQRWLDSLRNANISKNEIVKLYGMKVLVTDSLDVINSQDAAKKAFWAELKKLV
jgi:hypothetical protein